MLVTGDWNMMVWQWRSYLADILPDAVRKTVQLVKSTICGTAAHGDVTVAVNCQAFQEETPDWTTFSDAHNIVIANVALPTVPSKSIADVPASSSAEQPARSSDAPTASRTAQPPVLPAPPRSSVATAGQAKALDPELPLRIASSAEQPARSSDAPSASRTACQVKASDLEVPLSSTPLCAMLAQNFAELDADNADHRALDELEQTFMFGNVPTKQVPGHWDAENPSRLERLEWVLQLLQEQRDTHTRKRQNQKDARISAAQPDILFTDDDMKEIMNSWRLNPEKWMHPDNLARLKDMSGNAPHDFLKSRFGAMKFQLLGNEALVDHLIRFNLCGAVQPAMVENFCTSWRAYTHTEQYLKAKTASMKQEPGHVRRAKRIWYLKQKISRATWIAEWIDERASRWYRLSASDQELYSTLGDLERQLNEVLLTPPGERYRGSGSYLAQR